MSFEFSEDFPERYRDEVLQELRGRRGKMQVFRMTANEYYQDLLSTLVRKQADYGPNNIARAPGGPINGLLVRMNDKLQRLINLTYNNQDDAPTNEAIRDSYEDLANYCVIALMVLDGKWENLEDNA